MDGRRRQCTAVAVDDLPSQRDDGLSKNPATLGPRFRIHLLLLLLQLFDASP